MRKRSTFDRMVEQTHNAGAQGEPTAYMWRDGGAWELTFGAPPPTATKSVPLYAQPQPLTQTDAARDVQDAKRYRLLRERHFVRADNPNVSAYHCVGVFTSWLPAPTIDREGLDAVLDAEIERGEQPQAAEPKGMTEEQRETIRYAASILGELSYYKTARDLIALLALS